MQSTIGAGSVEEDFIEFRSPCDLANRTHFHARLLDGHQQQHHAGMAGTGHGHAGFFGAGQHKDPFGLMRPRCPHLLAVNHPLARRRVAVGFGADSRQVRARAGFRVALSPVVGARQNAGQKAGLLLRRAKRHQRGGQQRLANVADTAGAAAAHIFLVKDDLLRQRCIAAAILRIPAQTRPAALGQFLLPLFGELGVIAFCAQTAGVLEGGELARQVLGHPFTHFSAKGFIDF